MIPFKTHFGDRVNRICSLFWMLRKREKIIKNKSLFLAGVIELVIILLSIVWGYKLVLTQVQIHDTIFGSSGFPHKL